MDYFIYASHHFFSIESSFESDNTESRFLNQKDVKLLLNVPLQNSPLRTSVFHTVQICSLIKVTK